MPRARTGTLVKPGRDGFHRARVTKDNADGTTSRPLYSLGTSDKTLAKRKLAKINAALARGDDITDAVDAAGAPERVKEYADAWLEKRVAQKISMAGYERGYLTNHVLDAIGPMPMGDVTPSHVRSILDDVVLKGLKRATVEQVRGVLHRLFDDAWRAEIIDANPVMRVKMPPMREVKKARAILTDEEFTRFVGCAEVDLELRMLSLVARCEGGMRAGDLNAWDWSAIDRVDFGECFVPRSKTAAPQRLAIPEVLAPFLRAWWERAGKPESGPVFPARKGKRAGEFKAKKSAYANRLRRGLIDAAVFRLKPHEEVREVRMGRSKSTRTKRQILPDARDPLYFETASTLPVDFHSFRRAFNTGLAEAGVNVQHAMHLAAHADAKVHARYVMSTEAMRTVPAAALPTLPRGALATSGRDVSKTIRSLTPSPRSRKTRPEAGRIVTGRDDSDPEPDGNASFQHLAGLAQLVECQLPKLDVAGSNPVSRSVFTR